MLDFCNWSKWSLRILFYNQIISTIQVLYLLRTIICMDHSSEPLQYSRQSSSLSSERIEMRFSHFNEIHAKINIMSCLQLGFTTWQFLSRMLRSFKVDQKSTLNFRKYINCAKEIKNCRIPKFLKNLMFNNHVAVLLIFLLVHSENK